ncbi:helix-turn-helix domain-containing protein [Microtetraspora niveoalba]|uniref:helix-turn-helix domain-containing protein n=1 Tax=Microtetraspora niveoalba TaxID=46175 RepID=UPI000AD5DC6B|nr:helix-turn-helix domain-containing protein [Microtetraspora niveoalba]
MAAESAQTLERGLRLLRLLADGNRGRTPTELAQELGLSRPVVYRLLTTLQNEGFARRDAEGRVHLGFGVLVMAQAVQPLLRAAALPALRALAEQVGATAHLTVAEGEDGVAVAVVEPSWTDMHLSYREGSRHPLTRGAAGLAILALREETRRGHAATPAGSRLPGEKARPANAAASGTTTTGRAASPTKEAAPGEEAAPHGKAVPGGQTALSERAVPGRQTAPYGKPAPDEQAAGEEAAGEEAARPFLVTEGQLQEGARGIAVPVRGLPWLEASVGVVTFGMLDIDTVGPRVAEAARDLARTLAR